MMFKCKKRANQLLPLRPESRPITNSQLKIIRTIRRKESSLIARRKISKPIKISREPALQTHKEASKLEEAEVSQSFKRALPRK